MASKIKHIDAAGNERTLSASYLKKQVGKDSNILEYYQDSLADRLNNLAASSEDYSENSSTPEYPEGFKPYNNMWRYEPYDSRYWTKKILGEGLTPIQQEACDIVCGKDPFKFTNENYKEIDLFWGKRGGKDATIAKIFSYQVYKLCCLSDPQKFLNMGLGSNIDIANVSKSGQQARNVFFKYLKNYIKGATDVKTQQNWFSRFNFHYDIGKNQFVYQNLKEGESIQKVSIDFGRGITCHSLNGDTYTGEGLNLVLAVIDEVGSMPIAKILGGNTGRDTDVGLHDSLSTTLEATSEFSKLICVSYKYGINCAMSVLVRRNKKNKNVFISQHSTFEVRPDFNKDRVKKVYATNPTKAEMMYEIKDVDEDLNTFYDIPYVIDAAQDFNRKYSVNPFKDESVVIDNIDGAFNKLHKWFLGKPDTLYVCHLDLAKGQVWKGNDAIGLSISHLEDMRVQLDHRLKKYLTDKMGISDVDDIEGELRQGMVVDLACHVICKPKDKEVRLSALRNFIIALKIKRHFDFHCITYDGWQSLESQQEFNKYGLDSKEISVDKTPNAYMTEKDLIMMGLMKIYPNRIWVREKKELMDTGNKIDHPDISIKRLEDDNLQEGSKDLSDATAANAYILMGEVAECSNPIF